MVNRNLWIVTLIIGSLVTPPVISQELEEVIVTAQRIEQSLQEVPVSITAFSGVQLQLRAGIEGDRWSIIAYVENLMDNEYYTGTQENFGFGGIRIRPHPRIYGISFRLWSKE